VEQIRNLVAGCSICQERRNNNPAQQYYPAEVPEHPFQKVATDFFQLAGKNYLLTVDYFSKWPCVVEMSSTTSSATIRELEKIFSDFGVPETLVSDNGPQFGSAEFRVFSRQQQFSHVTSSPFYPASNGFVERSVQTVKSSFIKAIESGRSLHAAVRAIRSTPVGGGLPSPSVLLQSRHLRGSLPFVPAALKHQSINSGAVEELLKSRQDKMLFHQSSAVSKRYPVLSVGQRVRVRVGKKWIPGVVKIVCQQPDSYVVSTSDGREFRRNRRAINVCRSQQRECPATPPTVNQRAPAAEPSRRPRASFMFPSLSLSNSAAHSAASVKLRWWFLFPARRQATWWHPSCLYRQLAQRCLRLLSQSVRPFSPAPGKHASLESGRHAHARVRGWLPRTGGVFRTAQPGRRQVIRLQRSIPPS
jgi:hypothetical protein